MTAAVSDCLVRTSGGALCGERQADLRRWLGIPYARAGRFGLPQPPDAWTGTRQATAYGPQCPQQYGNRVRPEVLQAPAFGEDCLYLNVWTPDGGAPGPKPVLVWIHGGAFMAGSANPYDAAPLASEGDIVVVTINYRLGVLGFVNFGEVLDDPSIPSNLGLRDQIAALRWVQANIAAFGGDPDRVTICGESAGSMSVSLLMLAPSARGLFHAAVLQSGAISLIHDRERSLADARRFLDVLEIGPQLRGEAAGQALRGMDIARLIGAQVAAGRQVRNGVPAAPWFDGDLLPASHAEAARHQAAPVPLLAGSNRDEIVLFDLSPGAVLPSRWPDLEALLFAQLPRDHAERILAAYPRNRKGRIALASDLTFTMPTRHFAHRHAAMAPTWCYRFDYAHPIAGATHGLDLTVFWPFRGLKMALARGGPASGRRAALGRRMRAHVARFARTHAPGEDWPPYRVDERCVRIFDLADRVERDPQSARFTAWAGADVSPGKATGP